MKKEIQATVTNALSKEAINMALQAAPSGQK